MSTTLTVRAPSAGFASGDLSPLEAGMASSTIVTRQDFLDALKTATAGWQIEGKRNVVAHVLKHDPLLGVEAVVALGLELKDLGAIVRRKDVQEFQPGIVNQVTAALDLGFTSEEHTRFKERFPEIAKLHGEALTSLQGAPVKEAPLPEKLRKLFELYFAPQFKNKRFESPLASHSPELIEQVSRYFERFRAFSDTVTLTDRLLRSEEVPATITRYAVERFLVSELKDTGIIDKALTRYVKNNSSGSLSEANFKGAFIRGEQLEIPAYTRYEVLREIISSKVPFDRLKDPTNTLWSTNDLLAIARAFKIPDAFSKVVEFTRKHAHDRDPLLQAKRAELLDRLKREIAPKNEGFDEKTVQLGRNQRMVSDGIRITCLEHEPYPTVCDKLIPHWIQLGSLSGFTLHDICSGASHRYPDEGSLSRRSLTVYEGVPDHWEVDGGITLATPFGPWEMPGFSIDLRFGTKLGSEMRDRFLFGVTRNEETNGRVVDVHELTSDGIRMTGMSITQRNDSPIRIKLESGEILTINGSRLDKMIYLGRNCWTMAIEQQNYLVIDNKVIDLGFERVKYTTDDGLLHLSDGSFVDSLTAVRHTFGESEYDMRENSILRYGDGYLSLQEYKETLWLLHKRGDRAHLEREEITAPGVQPQPLKVHRTHNVAFLSARQGVSTLKNGVLVEARENLISKPSDVVLSAGYLHCLCFDGNDSTLHLMKINEHGGFEEVYSCKSTPWNNLRIEWSCESTDGQPFLTFLEETSSGRTRLNVLFDGRVHELPTNEEFLNSLRESDEGAATYVYDLLAPKSNGSPSPMLVELLGALESNSLSDLSKQTRALLEDSHVNREANHNVLPQVIASQFTNAIRRKPENALGAIPLTTQSILQNGKLAQSMLHALVPGLKEAIEAVLAYEPERHLSFLESCGSFNGRGADPQSEITATLACLDKPFYGALCTARLSRLTSGAFVNGATLQTKEYTPGSEQVMVTSARPGTITLAAPVNARVTVLDNARVETKNRAGILSAQATQDTFVRYTFQESRGTFTPASQAAYEQRLQALSKAEREDLLAMPLSLPAAAEGYLSEIAHHPPAQRAFMIRAWVGTHFYYEWEYKSSMRVRDSMSLRERLTYMSSRVSELKRQREEVGEDTRELEGKEFSGVCAENALLMVAMLRRSGIPAEVLTGFLVHGITIESKSAHAWAAAYLLDTDGHFRLVELDATGLSGESENYTDRLLEQVQEEQQVGARKLGENVSLDLAQATPHDELDLKGAAISRPNKAAARSFEAPLPPGAQTLQFIADTCSSFSALFQDLAERGEIADSPAQYLEWMTDAARWIPELRTDDGAYFLQNLLTAGLQERYGLSNDAAARHVRDFVSSEARRDA